VKKANIAGSSPALTAKTVTSLGEREPGANERWVFFIEKKVTNKFAT
jgi:hypothetical protein